MKILDLLLTLLLPSLVLLHLLVAPYTKVEESFNLQATHDILVYGTPTSNISSQLRTSYDHFDFPGAVPRTFIGAVTLAGLSRSILSIVGLQHGQFVVRAVLGLFNVLALLRYRNGLERAFGKATGRWYMLLQTSQFHVIYYASRTLPNMFAFGLCTLALREVLPMPITNTSSKGAIDQTTKRNRLAIYLLVTAGVIFRAELAILLATQLLYLLWQPLIALESIIPIGIRSVAIALGISIPIDSYFWQRPIWPELAGFFYNAVQGKSIDWGRSPFHAYFTRFLPKLLLNPAVPTLLIPYVLYLQATRRAALGLIVPSLAFITVYSFQPHKEARFIIYAIPPITACAAIGANYIFTRRMRSLYYRLVSLVIIASTAGSFAASTVMLAISSLNYPGGEALYRLHELVARDQPITSSGLINVHMDVLACMTGVSRFQQDHPSPPFPSSLLETISSHLPGLNAHPHSQTAPPPKDQYKYDKSESPSLLLDPLFWSHFHYVLTANPETVIGAWEILDTIYGYAGIEVLRPGQDVSLFSFPHLDRVARHGGVSGESFDDAAAEVSIEAKTEAEAAWVALGGEEQGKGDGGSKYKVKEQGKKRAYEIYILFREGIRKYITQGWWVQPKMEPKMMIMKRAKVNDRLRVEMTDDDSPSLL